MSDDVTKALSVLRETVGEAKALQQAQTNLINLVRMAGFSSWYGEPVKLTLTDVLQVSAVTICLDILAQDIAKTTLRLYRRLPNGGKQAVMPGEHPAALLLATEPNPRHHWYELIEMMMLHLGILQNAFWAKRILSNGTVTEIVPILPGRVRVLADDEAGVVAYEVKRETPYERILLAGLPDVLLEGEIIHFRGRMFDGLFGYSNLEAGNRTFNLAKALQTFQTNLFENDATLRGVFQMGPENSLSDEAFQRMRAQLTERFSALRKEAKPLILEEGMTFQGISMKSDEAEAQKAWDNAIVNVARQFRIPPHKIFHLINVKYENMETLEKSYVSDTLVPYCRRIELTLARHLLDRKERAEFFLEFDREEMVLSDPKAQAEMLGVLLPNGVLTIDEARQMRGRNPLPNGAGNVRLIGSTYTLVDDQNEVVIPAGGQQQDPAEDPADDVTTPDDSGSKGLRVISG
jgi:HK97 family phage portal protein